MKRFSERVEPFWQKGRLYTTKHFAWTDGQRKHYKNIALAYLFGIVSLVVVSPEYRWFVLTVDIYVLWRFQLKFLVHGWHMCPKCGRIKCLFEFSDEEPRGQPRVCKACHRRYLPTELSFSRLKRKLDGFASTLSWLKNQQRDELASCQRRIKILKAENTELRKKLGLPEKTSWSSSDEQSDNELS